MGDESTRELYEALLLDHNRRPRGADHLDPPCAEARLRNPLCGDRVCVQLRVEAGRLAALRAQAEGCAISIASASLMAETLEGRSLEEVRLLRDRFLELVGGAAEPDAALMQQLGPAAAFAGLRRYPTRLACGLLAWQTLEQALARATHLDN